MILAARPTHPCEAPPKRRRVLVHLTGRNGLIPVQRDVPGTGPEVEQALRALLRGPTPFEVAEGIGTEVPSGSQLLGVDVEDGVATVDLAPAFAAGGATASVRRRVQQIVHTATGCRGVAPRAPPARRRARRDAGRRRPAGLRRADAPGGRYREDCLNLMHDACRLVAMPGTRTRPDSHP